MDHENDILSGVFGHDGATLLSQSVHYPTLKEIKKYTSELIFSSDVVLPVEIAGYDTISGMLDAFGEVLHNYHIHAKQLGDKEKKLLRYWHINPDILENKYKSLLAFTDHISGMTDLYAIRQFQIFKGIRYR